MKLMTTYEEAFQYWNDEIRPGIPEHDEPMLAESWNNYTDSLGWPRMVYHYCPPWDDRIPEGTDGMLDFLMEQIGADIRTNQSGFLEILTKTGKWEFKGFDPKYPTVWETFLLELKDNMGDMEHRSGVNFTLHTIFGDDAKDVYELIEVLQ